MAITKITIEAAVDTLGSEATDTDVDRYLDHVEAALTAAYPEAEIVTRRGTTPTRIVADTDDEESGVRSFIEGHFNRGEWFQQ